MQLQTRLSLPVVGLTGFEPPLPPEELAIQDSVHRFAKDVLYPTGRALDLMTPEDVIAPGSPYWLALGKAAALGLDPAIFEQFPPTNAVRLESLIGEELGWGDAGLAVSIGASSMPLLVAQAAGNRELIELCTGRIGCWMITQPDRGSDSVILYGEEWPTGAAGNRGNLTARVVGDEIIINGQCSAWVSNGAVAQVALAYLPCDYGDGLFRADGLANGVTCIIPLGLAGISRGNPLDKIGQRSLPQGEIYFDDVKIPKRFAIALKDEYYGNLASAWAFAGTHMCQVFTGVARRAFELALAYAHERKQGGALLIDHQLTRVRLGDMGRRVEMIRAVARRTLECSRLSPSSHPYVTAQGKVSVTDEAMKVVHEAFQLFGGVGCTREFPIEKLYRDTRAALIEDGENNVLTMRFGTLLSRLYQDGWTRS